jgi:hypothetical protein
LQQHTWCCVHTFLHGRCQLLLNNMTKSYAFVCLQDQAPLQNRAPDWQLGSKGCYDAATLAALQKTLADNLEAVADGNAEGCLSLPLPEEVMQLLKQVRTVARLLIGCGHDSVAAG